MNKQLSSKHHYIPEFLIKKFADKNGKVWVYNKEKGRFDKDRKFPAGVFYKKNGNTFDLNGEPSDLIEAKYSKLETMISPVLDQVLQNDVMSGQELSMLIYLASLMKWRVPGSDKVARELAKSIDIEDLGLKFVNANTKNAPTLADLEELQNHAIIIELKRLLLTVQPIINQDVLSEIHPNCYIVTHFDFPALLGDKMLIENKTTDHTVMGDFILPLSENKTLICKRGGIKQNPHDNFPFWKDLAIFHLSDKLVTCKDKDHLQYVINTYQQIADKGLTDHIIRTVFEHIA